MNLPLYKKKLKVDFSYFPKFPSFTPCVMFASMLTPSVPQCTCVMEKRKLKLKLKKVLKLKRLNKLMKLLWLTL